MGSGTLANDAKQIIALYSPLESVPYALWPPRPRLLWFTGQACTCTVCVRSPDAWQNSLKRATHSGRGGWGSGGANQTPALGFPDSRSPLFFPSRSTHPNTPSKIQPLLYWCPRLTVSLFQGSAPSYLPSQTHPSPPLTYSLPNHLGVSLNITRLLQHFAPGTESVPQQ